MEHPESQKLDRVENRWGQKRLPNDCLGAVFEAASTRHA